MKLLIFITFSIIITFVDSKPKKSSPPHCTQVSKERRIEEPPARVFPTRYDPGTFQKRTYSFLKDTDYQARFKLDYPTMYIVPGQREAYQQMFCLNPPAVNKAVTIVCDWAAPPQVQFTLGDDYMHVVRQDPSGRFLGNVVITTYQLCGHNISHVESNELVSPIIAELN